MGGSDRDCLAFFLKGILFLTWGMQYSNMAWLSSTACNAPSFRNVLISTLH